MKEGGIKIVGVNMSAFKGAGNPGDESRAQAVNVTHSELLSLRNNSQLTPGAVYRITDYVTTTAQADTMSAGHAFDILVVAQDAATLSETAYAALHEGDLYFADSKLEAWELKYCIDNDTNRFAWADIVNGKGVIYGMKDEWGNQCGYDFKNILFKRCYCEPEEFEGEGKYIAIPGLEPGPQSETLPSQDDDDFVWMYTFSCLAGLNEDPSDNPGQADASIGLYQSEDEFSADYGDSPRPLNNIIDPYFVCQAIDDEPLKRVMALPNITFGQFYTASSSYNVRNNHFGGDCHDLSIKAKQFYDNTIKAAQYSYFFGDVEHSSFGDVWNSSFGDVEHSSFGNVYSSSFGNVNYSSFGDVLNSSFGDVDSSSFGDVRYSSFGYVYYSSFGNVVSSSFGNVYSSSFGDVRYSSFGDVLNSSFGNVNYSSFGYVYRSQFFGYVGSSSFGDCTNVRGSEYLNGVHVSPASNGGTIKNVEFIGAINGKTFTVPAANTAVLYVAVDSDGEVKQWYPANIVQ